MTTTQKVKYIHESGYVAEVDVELHHADNSWSPYLSLQDAYKLDDVREALKRGDLEVASNLSRVFTMQPIAISG